MSPASHEALYILSLLYSRAFSGVYSRKILPETACAKADILAFSAAVGAYRRRRSALLAFSPIHSARAYGDRTDHDRPLSENAPNFPVEIRHHCTFRLRGIRLHKQSVQRHKCGCSHAFPSAGTRPMVLPADMRLLQRHLLVGRRRCLLSCDACSTCDDRGR